MRESPDKHYIGYYLSDWITNPKNYNDRDNPQERLLNIN